MKKLALALIFSLVYSNTFAYQFVCDDHQGQLSGSIENAVLTFNYQTTSEDVAVSDLQVTAPHAISVDHVNAVSLKAERVWGSEAMVFSTVNLSQLNLEVRSHENKVIDSESFTEMQNHSVSSSIVKKTSGYKVIVELESYNSESLSPVLEVVKKTWIFDQMNCVIK